jgi:hypothetical protein
LCSVYAYEELKNDQINKFETSIKLKPFVVLNEPQYEKMKIIFMDEKTALRVSNLQVHVWKGVKFPLRHAVVMYQYIIYIFFLALRIGKIMEALELVMKPERIQSAKYIKDFEFIPTKIKVVTFDKRPESIKLNWEEKMVVLFLDFFSVRREMAELNKRKFVLNLYKRKAEKE